MILWNISNYIFQNTKCKSIWTKTQKKKKIQQQPPNQKNKKIKLGNTSSIEPTSASTNLTKDSNPPKQCKFKSLVAPLGNQARARSTKSESVKFSWNKLNSVEVQVKNAASVKFKPKILAQLNQPQVQQI